MTDHNTETRGGGSGRTALWALLALALAALAYLTLGLAIPNNPLYSDRNEHGISKYQFLEQCQDGIAEAQEMGQIRDAMIAQQAMGADDNLRTELLLDSPELVDSISVSTDPQQSWSMSAPVLVRSELTHKPLIQVYSDCHYDRNANQTVVTLRPGGMM